MKVCVYQLWTIEHLAYIVVYIDHRLYSGIDKRNLI